MKRIEVWIAALLLVLMSGLPPATWADQAAPPVRDQPAAAQLRARLPHIRAETPAITAAAEAVAKRWVEHPDLLLTYPFGGDGSNFTMEFISRAGGLDNAQLNTMRLKLRTPHDVFVCNARSWEKGGAFLKDELPKRKADGSLIVLFASKAGAPDGLPVDFLIDNGAAGGGDDEAAVNQIVNMTQGWMFSSELVAAMTRLGQRPAILKGMPLPGAIAHNKEYQRSDQSPRLYACDTPIPAGKLAAQYLAAVEDALRQLDTADQRAQIEKAAEIAAKHAREGKTLWASSMTHVLDGEVFLNNRSPIKAFRGISTGEHGETFTENLKPGDLLFYFGEWTLNLPWRDYLALIRSTKADFIPSYRPFPEPKEPYEQGNDTFYDQKLEDAAMVLEQHWPLEGAVVDIPFPPGKMAPISGVYTCLLYRALDEAIAGKLGGAATQPAATAQP